MKDTKTAQQPRMRSRFNFELKDKDMEQPKGESLTVPDDSFTVQELLTKHQQGISFGVQKLGHFEELEDDDYGAHDLEKFQQLEPGERNEILQETEEIIERGKEWKKRKKAEIDSKKAEKPQNPENA